MLEYIPENLDFDVRFEPTKVDDKKYVINATTDEYIGIVGNGFTCASHGDFFRDVMTTATESLSEYDMAGANIKWRDAHKNGWAMMDMTLPNVNAKIITDKHETTVAQRIIALHGVNGTCSNVTIFGAIDFFCLNGQIRGRHDKVLRKNTSNFSLDSFISELEKSQQDFTAQTEQMQRWANTSLAHVDVKSMLEKLMKSERKAEKMNILYNQEVATRGRNLWSLYSAFTNYATYADERNGFKQRNTGGDTQAKSLFLREVEVAQWVDSPVFKSVGVAA
jgi:hypothetical protein|tara:strand:- start:1837 stop:2670 length:834 start_codon:yes stop_codon:yes gene_type:complete